MKIFNHALPLLILALGACEPIGTQKDALDSNALFDQKPVRSEGWTVEGQSSTHFDGLNLVAAPTSQNDAISRQEITLNNSSITKVFPTLNGQDSGTARVQFNIPKLSPSGIKMELSFLTGLGLPSEVRITEAGLTAKCGSLNLIDSLPTASAAKVIEVLKDYELRILRSATQMSVVLNDEVLIKDLACDGVQDPNEEPRIAGSLKFTLFSKLPEEPLNWTVNEMLLHENQVLLKRITIYNDLVLE